jgi:hypothetical protein
MAWVADPCRLKEMPTIWRAPSWSWASTDSGFFYWRNFDSEALADQAEVLSVELDATTDDSRAIVTTPRISLLLPRVRGSFVYEIEPQSGLALSPYFVPRDIGAFEDSDVGERAPVLPDYKITLPGARGYLPSGSSVSCALLLEYRNKGYMQYFAILLRAVDESKHLFSRIGCCGSPYVSIDPRKRIYTTMFIGVEKTAVTLI